MENNAKTCPRDCLRCHPNQRLYCAAYMSMTSLERMDELMAKFVTLEDKVNRLENADEAVFNPMGKGHAQEASGAENRLPKETTIKQE